jgi:dethiobiotin synthetase
VRDLLVTGTDTGVGKTIIAAAILEALRAKGIRAVGFKPVQTGSEPGVESDADLLAAASREHLADASPLIDLREPLAPALAAERAGVHVSPSEIESRVGSLRSSGRVIVVEGAGGVMVPLVWGYTVLDLAEHCGLEAIVVARAGLGTLNHIAMTVSVLRARRISVRAIVLNGRRQDPDLAESTNPSVLARLLPESVIIEVPHLPCAAAREVVAAAVPYIEGLVT